MKRDGATQIIDLYWYDVDRKKCVLRREQFVWRLIDGKAHYVHYRIFDKPDSSELPPVDGVRNGKCEYGLEILVRWIPMKLRRSMPICLPAFNKPACCPCLLGKWTDTIGLIPFSSHPINK